MTVKQFILAHIIGIAGSALFLYPIAPYMIFFFCHVNGEIRVIREGEAGK